MTIELAGALMRPRNKATDVSCLTSVCQLPTPSTTSTESTSTSTTPTTTTSSDALRAGPAVIQMLNVIVALLLTPMLL
ncbi:hypothetical protein TcWFU_006643 [Taenia crassiceps]|uniref:Uncharacterized protein n=1 Tax=Taenia crassiceps TaxID=6207 RepID=A0ABR4Q8C9_9CEST